MRSVNQGVNVLVDLRAGQSYGAVGGSFTRATVASYVDRTRRLRYAAAGVLRDDHWVKGKRGWLLEPNATQICPQPQTPASWTGNIGTPVVTTGITDPWGGNAAIMVEDNNGSAVEGMSLNTTFTADGVKALLFVVRAGTLADITIGLRDITAGVNRHYVRVLWNGASAPTCTTNTGSGKILEPYDIVDADGITWWCIGMTVDGVVAANVNALRAFSNTTASTAPTGTFYLAGANAWNSPAVHSWQPSSGHVRNRDQFTLPHGMVGGADYTVYTEGFAQQTTMHPDANYTITTWWGITRTTPNWGIQLRLNAGAANRRPQVCLLAPTGSGTQAATTEDASGKSLLYHTPYVRAAVQIRGSTNPAAVAIAARYDDESTVYQTTYTAGDLSAAVSAWTSPLIQLGGYDANPAGVFLTRIRIVPGLVSLTQAALGVVEAIESAQGEMVHFIDLDFSAGPVRLTTAGQDLDWDGISWQAVGGHLEVGPIEETSDGRGQGVDLHISGVDQTVLALLLAAQWRGRDVRIYRAYYNKATGLLIGDPQLVHQGLQLSPYVIEEENSRSGGTVRIRTRLSGYLALPRVRGIQSNLVGHQHVFPGDTFFQHAASLGNVKIYWGTAIPAGTTRTAQPRRNHPMGGG